MDSLGLGYESLAAESPGLVYASITPFGQTGPYRDFKASDLVGFAMGGYMYVTGWPDTPPNKLWGSQAYHTASNRAYVAILLALYHRTMTGQGQYIDVSMQEAVAATTEHVNTTYNYTGESAVRCGFRHGGQFVATWRCQDGYASITTNTRKAWGRPAGLDAPRRHGRRPDDEQYNDHFVLRGEHSAHIEELIQAWAMLHTRQEITEFGQSNHHPWGPAATANEILENEQLWGGDTSRPPSRWTAARPWCTRATRTGWESFRYRYDGRPPPPENTTPRCWPASWGSRRPSWNAFPPEVERNTGFNPGSSQGMASRNSCRSIPA